MQVVREAAYDSTSKEVGKWQEVVLQHRRAEQLVFPLKQEIATVVPLERVVSAWKVGAAPGALLGQLLAAQGGAWCW